MAALRFETVGLRFGKAAELLSDVSFAVERGELALIVGGPATGKTSLLAVAGLRTAPSRGLICLFGRDGSALRGRERRTALRRIGFVGAEDDLVDGLSIEENLALPLRIAGLGQEERAARCGGALARIGLAARAQVRPAALSRSERRRIALARATIAAPDLLLVDDVDGGADPGEVARRLRTLADAAARGAAVLATAGAPAAAGAIAGATIHRIDRGRLQEAASIARRGAA